jgi:hypothetical protein
MKPFETDVELIAELRELRPTPRLAFAAELDERVAAGFPRRSWLDGSALAGLDERIRALSPRRLLLSAGATTLAAIALATVVVIGNEGGSRLGPDGAKTRVGHFQVGAPLRPYQYGNLFKPPQAIERGNLAFATTGAASRAKRSAASVPFPGGAGHRDVERSAEIVLGARPEDVGEDSAAVFDAVHAANGIVLRSSTVEGPAGKASADFDLLIPSTRLGDALADLSQIDEVRSRHEATADITAPTVAVAGRLRDSRARIEGLLAQLAGAESEGEREAVGAELRAERRRLAFLRARSARLDRRASFSRVSLRIETGSGASAPTARGSWGIGDALSDAGHILTIAAAVTVVSLAVLAPIALIALIALLTQRAWVRRGRERALG